MIQISPESYKISLASKETNTLQGDAVTIGYSASYYRSIMDDRMRLDALDLNACLLFVSRRSGSIMPLSARFSAGTISSGPAHVKSFRIRSIEIGVAEVTT